MKFKMLKSMISNSVFKALFRFLKNTRYSIFNYSLSIINELNLLNFDWYSAWGKRETKIEPFPHYNTYRVLYSWKEPPSSRRILANKTAFKNGTSTSSSKFKSTENLYFFFFIMNAIPGALGPINVIHTDFIPEYCWNITFCCSFSKS